MLYGIAMTPGQWVVVLFLALLLVFAPFVVIQWFAELLPKPLDTIVLIVFVFILFPVLVCYVYRKKMFKSGKAGVLFFVYVLFYAFFFIMAFLQLLISGPSLDAIAGVIVSGSVTFYMLYTAFKTKREFEKLLQAQQEAKRQHDIKRQAAEREDDVKRQAEAILLAEKMKEQNKNP